MDVVPAPPRRLWLFALTAGLFLFLVVLENGWAFTQPYSEDGDYAANSLAVMKAKRGQLLVGNYSRVGFNHPGPAFLYVQAAGETVFHDLLGVVASPLNGQFLALRLLDALFLGGAAVLLAGALRSQIAAAVVGVMVAVGYAHLVELSCWPPHLYCSAFLGLIAGASAVGSGRWAALPFATLAGGFLFHGHVCFIAFVGIALVYLYFARWGLYPRPSAVRAVWKGHRWGVAGSLLIFAVIALPVVLNTIINYPGEFPKYWKYKSGVRNSPGDVAEFILAQWGVVGWKGWTLAVGLLAVVSVLWLDPDTGRNRFSRALLILSAVLTGMLVVYGRYGVDNLTHGYTILFSRMIPFALAVVVIGTRIDRLPRVAQWELAAALLVAGVLLMKTSEFRVNQPMGGGEGMREATAELAARAGGARLRLTCYHGLDRSDWPNMAGVLVQLSRLGVPAVVDHPMWLFMVGKEFIDERRPGDLVVYIESGPPKPGETVWVTYQGHANTPVRIVKLP